MIRLQLPADRRRRLAFLATAGFTIACPVLYVYAIGVAWRAFPSAWPPRSVAEVLPFLATLAALSIAYLLAFACIVGLLLPRIRGRG